MAFCRSRSRSPGLLVSQMDALNINISTPDIIASRAPAHQG
jgi:hypothetical protein